MGAYRRRVGILYAGRLLDVRSGLYKSKEYRKHFNEKSDGFLYRHTLLLACRLRPYVRNGNCRVRHNRSLIMGDYSDILPQGVPLRAFAIFQTVFCATAATIVSGAMAERTKFSSYCIYSAAISLLIYTISGHRIWGEEGYDALQDVE